MILVTFLLLLQSAPGQVSPAAADKNELLNRRLLLVSEYATVKLERLAKEEALEALRKGTFAAARDETLRKLTEDLGAAEDSLKEVRRRYAPDSPECRAAADRVASSVAKVRSARENLVQYFEAELLEATAREKQLESSIRAIQKLIDPPPPPPPPPQRQPEPERVKIVVREPEKPQPKTGDFQVNRNDELMYIYVAPGSFRFGCVEGDSHCRDDERPAHQVNLKRGFWIGQHEVSVEAYSKFAMATRRAMPDRSKTNLDWRETQHPISRVTWEDAARYCKWAGGRLPTEAQWEYAAKAGHDNTIYPWGNEASHEYANYLGTSKRGGRDKYELVAPIRSFPKNAWGMQDMIGNVAEWVSDFYSPSLATGPETEPAGPEKGAERVIRGGSFQGNANQIRTTVREHSPPDRSGNWIGFRCAIDNLDP